MKMFGAILLGFFIGYIVGGVNNPTSHKPSPDQHVVEADSLGTPATISTSPSPPRPSTVSKWAHRTVNIRAGRGTQYDIAATLTRGEKVQVDSLDIDWYRVSRNGKPIGYALSSLLKDTELPQYDLEINDVSFRVTESNSQWWRFAWNLKISNTGRNDLHGLTAVADFLDGDGFIVDSDREYNIYVRAGDFVTVRGDCLISVPGAGTVASIYANVGQ